MNVVENGQDNFKIVDEEKGIDCVYNSGKITGKGSRKYKDEISRQVEIAYNDGVVNAISDSAKKQKYTEMFALSELINDWGTSTSLNDVSIRDLHKWQKNPIQYNEQLRKLALYYYGQKGVITETYEMYKTLPNLNSSIFCNNPNGEKYTENLVKINEYDLNINKPTIIRGLIFDSLFGTVVGYIRNRKQIQTLDLNIYKPARKINNRWQVDCDLTCFEKSSNVIESQPIEVQNAYRKYKDSNGKIDSKYSLNIKNTFVIKIRSKNNEILGRPVAMSAFDDLLHKELLKEAEKAIVDRIVAQLIYLKLGESGEKGFHPTKSQSQKVYNAVKTILDDKDKGKIKFAGIPFWAEIDKLDVDLGIFDDKKYTQIDKDIMIDLGVSGILSTGDGGSYSSGSMNVQIFFQKIFEIIEQIEEEVFNVQYRQIVKDKDYIFYKKFTRAVTLNNDTRIETLKDLVDMGGSIKFLTDELGIDFEQYRKQVERENALGMHDILTPYMKSYTMTDSADTENPDKNSGINKEKDQEKEV